MMHTALTIAVTVLVLAVVASLYRQYVVASKPKPAPDPLDRPADGPTVKLLCLGCKQTVAFGVHTHETPFGIILHVNQDDIELHNLTCSSSGG